MKQKTKHKQITGITKYTTHDIHELLCKRWLKDDYHNAIDYIETQALLCPYYVPLLGPLGSDWGVIVNPKSSKFGCLVFEHDFCGCPDHWKKVGHQDGRDWINEKEWDDIKDNDYYDWYEED
jgi:hypothetical protein